MDMHRNENVPTQQPKEHLLKAKKIPAYVIGPSNKIAFKDKIAPLDF
jgi:hypothetical protein